MQNLVQVDLRSGSTAMTCWVEPKIKIGNRITLKNSDDPSRLWDVVGIGEAHPASDITTSEYRSSVAQWQSVRLLTEGL